MRAERSGEVASTVSKDIRAGVGAKVHTVPRRKAEYRVGSRRLRPKGARGVPPKGGLPSALEGSARRTRGASSKDGVPRGPESTARRMDGASPKGDVLKVWRVRLDGSRRTAERWRAGSLESPLDGHAAHCRKVECRGVLRVRLDGSTAHRRKVACGRSGGHGSMDHGGLPKGKMPVSGECGSKGHGALSKGGVPSPGE